MFDWRTAATLFVDTETTGPDPESALVVELGAAWCPEGNPDNAVTRFGTLINPGVPIPPESTAIHGITDEDVEGAPSLEEVADSFLARVVAAEVLGAYNWPYDCRVLGRALGTAWDDAIADKPVLDPLVVVRFENVGRYWKGKGRHKLQTVADRFKLKRYGRAHRASSDAELALRVLHRLQNRLPEDANEAAAIIEREREDQDANFHAWKAAQPVEAPRA